MSQKNKDEHNRWRNKTVAFRVSPEEDQQIEAYVAMSGLTKQDYITRRLMHRDVVVQGNPRVYKACTTSCLVSKNIARDCVPLKFESSLHRPVIGCTFHGTDLGLFTYHATANDAESVLEVKKIIEALNTECGSNGKWILMGDFNSTPDRYDCDNRPVIPNWLNYIRVSSTRARATERDYCYLLFSDRPT